MTITDSGGSTTYTEDDDYVVHSEAGLIYIVPNGAISDNTTILVDYDYSISAKRIKGSRNPEIICTVLLNGMNKVNGKNCLVTVYEAHLTPSSEVDFLADDFATLLLEGTMVVPGGKDHLYKVDYWT